MKPEVQDALEQLAHAWEQERLATSARFEEERQQQTLAERVENGMALDRLALVEITPAQGGRLLLWIQPERENALRSLRLSSGAPVRLWWQEGDAVEGVQGTVARVRRDKLGVMIDGEVPPRLEEGLFQLDREAPQATFDRGARALKKLREAPTGSIAAELRKQLFGEYVPEVVPSASLVSLDASLNASQREAVSFALSAPSLALIHGPPGTGKTKTLVEIVRQAFLQGKSVLATAASNAAVDNLAERLVAASVPLIRLGHPARVSEKMEAHTLDALLEKTDAWELSKRWTQKARELQRTLHRRSNRGQLRWSEKKALRKEIAMLYQDARRHLREEQQTIVRRAQILCATAAGADSALLHEREFDLVIMDEATQATDPIALVAFCRGRKVVLAGDPCQLPPTVISREAEGLGLGSTFFERLAATDKGHRLRLLTIQYRMPSKLMSFPSESMYQGELVADQSNAMQTLCDLEGILEDPERAEPLCFLDTAGKGWEELRQGEDPSTSNPEAGARVAKEVRRLISRGLHSRDIAVITPYYSQVRLLRELLESESLEGLEIDTVDGFQGREKQAVVLDLVRCNENAEIGFLSDTRRMNVAITRAKRFLLVIGDSATVGAHPYYERFLAAAESQGAWQSVWEDDAPTLERWE